MQTIKTIDTHTGGEPTRVVVSGGPDLGTGSMTERAVRLEREGDWMRRTLILEPRGCDWMVGAILQEPCNSRCVAGVIFFNNVGYLGMCGHGLIGVVTALAYSGRISPGLHQFETPAGIVSAHLHNDRSVSFANVESFRWRKDIEVQVPSLGPIVGDVAYGGNWFFLSAVPRLDSSDIDQLMTRCRLIRAALEEYGVCGADDALIDHIELFAPPNDRSKADARSFVLCPGAQYDRSPCGTGTSAKLACLAADGVLQPDELWRQESIIGSVFEGRYSPSANGITPRITGRAYVTAESKYVLEEDDPYRYGIQSLA